MENHLNRIEHFQSNGAVPYLSLTLTFIFKVKLFDILLSLRTSRKCWKIESKHYYYLHIGSNVFASNGPLIMLYIVILTYIFQGHKFSGYVIYNNWKIVRSSEKYWSMPFIEIDIIHRMAPLRMLYIVTLTYIFKVTKISGSI